MTVRTLAATALACLLALACAATAGAAARKPDPLAVPNLERDCGPSSGSGPAVPADPQGTRSAANPLAADHFFVDPSEPSVKDYVRYKNAGQKAKADTIARLAFQPKARWVGLYTRPNMPAKVAGYINCAQVFQPGSTPLFTVLRAQGKECNSHYQAGGVAEDRATVQWYRDFAQAVGSARVVIAFEPDSIGTLECLARSRRAARLAVLREGVDVMSKLPNATVYLEGTASDWKSARFTASKLKAIGISKVRGFMLNVTHYDWTSSNIAYGRKVSKLVGGKPFVVSTSYNGRGPVHYKKARRVVNVFCNPQYRGLGVVPTTSTHVAGVDAFLWLNRPGLSGAGACNGGPHIGDWWPARGLMFAKYATSWLGPPKGTRFGFSSHISLCRLGAPLANGRYSTVAPSQRCR
jgi:endoglucanase